MSYQPSLISLIAIPQLPESILSNFKNIHAKLAEIKLKEIQISIDNYNDSKCYYVKLAIGEIISFDFFGSGIILVINPDSENQETILPVSLTIQNRFESISGAKSVQNFNGNLSDFFYVFLKVLNIDEKLLFFEVFSIFRKDNTKEDFINTINNIYELNPPLQNNSEYEISLDFEDIVKQIESNDELHSKEIDIITLLCEVLFQSDLVEDKEEFFKRVFSAFDLDNPIETIWKYLLPEIDASIIISPRILIPRKYIIPVKSDGTIETDINKQLGLDIAETNFKFSTSGKFGINTETLISLAPPYTKGLIPNTDFSISFETIKLDLSQKTNIKEAILDNRPTDFIGVYLTEASIGFPAKWNHDPEDSANTAQIKARNLLIGTGGISGSISLEAIDPEAEETPLLKLRLGENFNISLDAFSLTFQQNEIINSQISGKLTLPSFKKKVEEEYIEDPVELDIEVFIGNNGDFKISAMPVEEMSFYIEKVAKITVNSLAIGEEDDKFYADISGEIDFSELTANLPNISSDMPTNVPIRKLRVWEDGKMEFDAGKIHLPRSVTVYIGLSRLVVNSLLFSSTELYHDGKKRTYNVIGFDGDLSISPGGINMQGDGIKIYYTTDNVTDSDPEINRPAHVFIRLEKLDITIVVPEGSDRADAQFYLHGTLSIKNKDGEGASELQHYSGSIDFAINKAKISGSAAIEYTPQIPRWFIDAQVDISSGIKMGTSGLSIYGFKGLVGKGKRFVKDEEETWWKFYKKPTKGINQTKFQDQNGFALGLGVSIASETNEGKPFSSIVTLILGLPDVVMLNGRAAFMQERVKFNDQVDPPFSVLLSIDSKSIQAGIGINTTIGKYVELNGSAEMAYFWNDAKAWYVNIGKDLPESDRIKARIDNMFDAYAYLMLSASGVRFGAGAKWEKEGSLAKAVTYGFKAYLDIYARFNFRPSHMGGGIALGGEAYLKVSKFRLAFIIAAYLHAESYKPKQIKGGVEVTIELPKPLKSKSVRIGFDKVIDTERDTTPLEIFNNESENGKAIQAVNMLTGEVFDMGNIDQSYSSMDDYPVIPVDSFVDVTFMNSPNLNITASDSIVVGGEVTAVNNTQLVPPIKGISEQVRHLFEINGVKVEAHNGSTWQPYNIFEASDTIKAIPEIASELSSNVNYLKGLPQAYWQLNNSGVNTTLRVMASNMFSYLNQTLAGSIEIERLGYEGGIVFCEQSKIQENEINWENETIGDTYTPNTYYNKDGVRIKVFNKEGAVNDLNLYGLINALEFTETDGIEIVFNEPQIVVKPKLSVSTGDYLHVEYIGKSIDGNDINGFPIEKYITLRTDKLSSSQVATYIGYSEVNGPVFKIRVTYFKTGMLNPDHDSVLRIGYSSNPTDSYEKLNGLIVIDDLMLIGRAFDSSEVNDIMTNGYSGGNIIGHWELNGNGNDSSGNSFNGTSYGSPSAFPGRNNSVNNAYYLGKHGNISTANEYYFEVSHSAALSVGKENFSIMAWVKIPANPTVQAYFLDNWYIGEKTIVSKTKNNDGGYQFYIEVIKDLSTQKLITNLCFEFLADSSLGSYKPIIKVECNDLINGDWHHVAIVKSFGYDYTFGIETNVIDFYIDGSWYDRKPIAIPVSSSSDKAAIIKMNYLNQESYFRNLKIPSQSVLNSMNNKMKDGLTKSVQPIWRPDTKYRIQISGNEIIDGNNNFNTYNINFQTKGATGYFIKDGIEIDDDKFKLGRIQGYIDYDRSHPNAAGKLLESKPLYFESAVLNLFYKAPYMNLMFDQWSTYQGLSATEYNLKVQVMDSRTGENISSELEPIWTFKEETLESQDIKTINNLLENGPNCWGDAGSLKRKTASAAYELSNLLPTNLYTTTYFSVDKNADPDTEVEVHKHVFQTSKFANFVEHVSSFRYTRPEVVNVVQMNEDFNSGSVAFSASSGSSLSMSEMVLIESAHNPSIIFTFSAIFGVPYEVVGGLKGYSYNFGGRYEFYCKIDKNPLYSGNLMNLDREPQELVYRFYSEKTGDTNIEFGMTNNKIGILQHFVLDWMKVRIPVFNEILINKTFLDGDLGSFQALSGSSISNGANELHVENINAPKAGIYFDALDGVTYTITFDVLAVTANGGGSQDLFCAVSGMLAQSLNVSGSFPQTLTCNFTANSSGTKLLEIYFDTPTTLGTTESFDIDNFKIEHAVSTSFDLINNDFNSGLGDMNTNLLSHNEPQGVLYVESDSDVPSVEIPMELEANAKYNIKFKIPAQSYNEGELKINIKAGTLFDEDLEAGTGSELSFDFATTTGETVDLIISLKDASSSNLEYFMVDDFSLSYSKTEEVIIESLFDRTIELDSVNLDFFKDILNDSEDQDIETLASMPLKYDRLIAAPLGSFHACERLEIHKFINQADDDALLGLIIRSPEPLFLPFLEGEDLENSLAVTCELPGSAGTVSEFKLVYSKDRTSVFVTNSDMDIPLGEYHLDFKYLTYNGATYSVKNSVTDQYELVINVN